MPTHCSPCGLCQEPKELRDSHLLPAAVYKFLRTPTAGTDPNPVVTTKNKAITSSKQVSSEFLCQDCEDRFSRNGERYILAQCARPNGQFKLRELLQAASPLFDTPNLKGYDAQSLLGSRLDQYLYFAASVFWRASAHRWTMGNEKVGRISLGDLYQEQFRLYLLGRAAFSQNARIFIHVSSEACPDLMTTVFPCTSRGEGVRRHKFYIPGLLFILFLGKYAPQRFDGGALNGSRHRGMWLCPWQSDSLFAGSMDLMKTSTPLGKLRRCGRGDTG